MTYDRPPSLRSLAPVPLRAILGFGFAFHGYPKLFSAAGHTNMVETLMGMGVPAPGATAYLVGGFEFFGGLMLLMGFAVRSIAALGALEMLVAAVMVHAPSGFNFMNVTGITETGAMQFGLPGYEVNLLYMAGFVSLMLSGPGEFAVPTSDVHEPAVPATTERETTTVG